MTGSYTKYLFEKFCSISGGNSSVCCAEGCVLLDQGEEKSSERKRKCRQSQSLLSLELGITKHVPAEKVTDMVFQCLSCVLHEIMVTMGQVEKSLAFPEGPGTTSGIREYLWTYLDGASSHVPRCHGKGCGYKLKVVQLLRDVCGCLWGAWIHTSHESCMWGVRSISILVWIQKIPQGNYCFGGLKSPPDKVKGKVKMKGQKCAGGSGTLGPCCSLM